MLFERFLYRPTYVRPINGFLVSLGLVQVIDNVLMYLGLHHPPRIQPVFSSAWHVLGVFVPADSILVVVGSIVILIAFVLFYERTWTGLAIRALSSDSEVAAMMGIPVKRLVAGVYFLAGGLAGAGGAFIALTDPGSLGTSILIRGLVVVLLGGLGSVRGAVVAALALAAVENAVIWALASSDLVTWLDPIGFGVAVILLIYRPGGFVGGATSPIGP